MNSNLIKGGLKMNQVLLTVADLNEKFYVRLERAIDQAQAHEHEFVCYTQPIIKEKSGRCQMSYHIKSFKKESDLQQFLAEQKTYYHVLNLSKWERDFEWNY